MRAVGLQDVRAWLPTEAAEHKDDRGRVLVVGGTGPQYSGAALLAAIGAARCGAGVVTVALPRALAIALAGRALEVTFLPLAESVPGSVDAPAAREVGDALSSGRFRAAVVGPGGAEDEPARAFLLGVVRRTTIPSVIDAGALNALATRPDWHRGLPADAVLTPHPGEARRLAGRDVGADRVGWTERTSKEWRAVLVLKGSCTVAASPEGEVFVHDRPNPALATAGTGDVLAGCIGAFLAAGLTPFRAACLGVAVHGEAGATVAREIGATGALAMDLVARLPRALAGLRES